MKIPSFQIMFKRACSVMHSFGRKVELHFRIKFS